MNSQEPETSYVVLVDVVDSRKIKNRETFESRLKTALESVNTDEKRNLSTPFTQMKGVDEFGCVLETLSPIPDIISNILNRIYPTYARFAIASGEIDVGTEYETVAQMDGPAFHSASAMLDRVESDGLFVGVDTNSAVDELLASALNLLILERENLTDRQIEVILAYEKHGTQSKAAEELDLRQQAVSNSLRRANYMRRREIRRNLRHALESIYD